MSTHTYQLTATDPFRLDQLLSRLRHALGIRGGRITRVQLQDAASGKHAAWVRYEVPTATTTAHSDAS